MLWYARYRSSVNDEPDNVYTTLAALSSSEIVALQTAVQSGTPTDPLRAYVAQACAWERSRRAQGGPVLERPSILIDQLGGDAASYGLADLLVSFQDSRAAIGFLFALADLLSSRRRDAR